MSAPWLSVVGIGCEGLPGLGERSRQAIAMAEALVGGSRHLAMLPEDGRQRLAWRSPLEATLDAIRALRPRPVAVLASGDPLWYGVGRLLLRHLPAEEVALFPHPSSFQEAAARLRWPLEDIVTLSVHGRAIDRVRRHLQPGRRLLVLGEDGATPAALALVLREAGCGPSRLWVLEELGGPRERVVERRADRLGDERFAALSLVAILVGSDGGVPPWPLAGALPDHAFAHDGQLTKQELRAIVLARLEPMPGALLWDIGAGAGGVCIDWLRADPSLRAVAVERDPGRAARLRANAARLGVPDLALVEGTAPACLDGLPAPDAVFLGGGVADAGLLEACLARLRPGGTLLAHAVTLAGERALLACHARHGGGLFRIAVARAESLGRELAWRPALPVTQLSLRKPCAAES